MIIKMQSEWMCYVIKRLVIKFILMWDHDFFDTNREMRTL